MNSRLSQFLSAENLTQAQFADSIGVGRASISHIMSGRNKPSYEFLSAMMAHYPEVNYEWLILGKGKMYRSSAKSSDTTPSVSLATSSSDLLFPAEFGGETPSEDENQNLVAGYSTAEQTVTGASRENLGSDEIGHGDNLYEQGAVQSRLSPSATAQNAAAGTSGRKIVKIVALFDDGSYQELK